jgi:hypothetical protein
MRPLVIVSRAMEEKDLAHYGYGRHSVALASQASAFMTSSLFELWAETIFLPAVEEWRISFRYQRKAVLLLDGLEAHQTDRFLQACSERFGSNGIKPAEDLLNRATSPNLTQSERHYPPQFPLRHIQFGSSDLT